MVDADAVAVVAVAVVVGGYIAVFGVDAPALLVSLVVPFVVLIIVMNVMTMQASFEVVGGQSMSRYHPVVEQW